MRISRILFISFLFMILSNTSFSWTTVQYDWSDVSNQFVLGRRIFTTGTPMSSVDHYSCGIRTWASGVGHPVQGDFYFAWVVGLNEGDIIHFEGKGCDEPYGARFGHFWASDCDQIIHDSPCAPSDPVHGNEIFEADYIVPSGVCGLVICGVTTSYGIHDWIQLTVPDQASVWFPSGLVESPVPAISEIEDVPNDQGGFLNIAWQGSPLEGSASPDSVLAYDIQRKVEGNWTTLATVQASHDSTYQVMVSTEDIYSAGQPEPFSFYKIIARTIDPGTFFSSIVDSAYSIDNIAPPVPDAFLIEDDNLRLVVCNDPEISDLGQVCFYRGTSSGFVPEEPAQCSLDLIFNEPYLVNLFYRVQFMDIHGNLSEFSDEITLSDPSSVGDSLPLVFGMDQNFPNPFNPSTTIKFSLPSSSAVTLRIYDVSGKLVRTILDGKTFEVGHQDQMWDGKDDHGLQVSTGVYFYKLTAGEFGDVKRMVLVK